MRSVVTDEQGRMADRAPRYFSGAGESTLGWDARADRFGLLSIQRFITGEIAPIVINIRPEASQCIIEHLWHSNCDRPSPFNRLSGCPVGERAAPVSDGYDTNARTGFCISPHQVRTCETGTDTWHWSQGPYGDSTTPVNCPVSMSAADGAASVFVFHCQESKIALHSASG